jgi:uncharacterized iron-regulated membrane protein
VPVSRRSIKTWFLVHKWTSLICTVFMLMLCMTGLPLIFHHEIDEATSGGIHLDGPTSSSNAAGLLSLDDIMARALVARPGEVPLFMAFSNDDPSVTVTTGPTADASAAEMTLQIFDGVTGRPLATEAEGEGVMGFLVTLHTDMFLGLPGMLFLGAMGLLFVVAIVSGVVLYSPFMRKLDFGTLRTRRSTRLRWLDWHNLLGITALAWMTVVGTTGVINALATPIFDGWRVGALQDMTRGYVGQPALLPIDYGSLDRAMVSARAARPGSAPQFIGFPGGSFSSRHHYAVFLQGTTPMTERMLVPALVDARTGELTDVRPMPWYVTALAFSRPLHFGDYGGLPLKILWAVLTLFTIVVLGSGAYLWLGRRSTTSDRVAREVESGGLIAVPTE